jgi:hypothetical protein
MRASNCAFGASTPYHFAEVLLCPSLNVVDLRWGGKTANPSAAILKAQVGFQMPLDVHNMLQSHRTQSSVAISVWNSALFGLPFLVAGALSAHGFAPCVLTNHRGYSALSGPTDSLC